MPLSQFAFLVTLSPLTPVSPSFSFLGTKAKLCTGLNNFAFLLLCSAMSVESCVKKAMVTVLAVLSRIFYAVLVGPMLTSSVLRFGKILATPTTPFDTTEADYHKLSDTTIK